MIIIIIIIIKEDIIIIIIKEDVYYIGDEYYCISIDKYLCVSCRRRYSDYLRSWVELKNMSVIYNIAGMIPSNIQYWHRMNGTKKKRTKARTGGKFLIIDRKVIPDLKIIMRRAPIFKSQLGSLLFPLGAFIILNSCHHCNSIIKSHINFLNTKLNIKRRLVSSSHNFQFAISLEFNSC